MNEMVSKTHDLLELSGNNIATYIARVKGESDVFANSPVLRQYLEENDESLRPVLMSDIEQLLKMMTARNPSWWFPRTDVSFPMRKIWICRFRKI